MDSKRLRYENGMVPVKTHQIETTPSFLEKVEILSQPILAMTPFLLKMTARVHVSFGAKEI